MHLRLKKMFWVMATVLLGASLASASNLTFTCASNVGTATCNTFNATVDGIYDNTFNNVNASIFIQYGNTGLGASTVGFYNSVSYASYLTALTANSSGDAVDVAALAAMNAQDTAAYGSNQVVITSALGTALGFSNLNGTTAGGTVCTISASDPSCYNGIITLTNNPILYYRNGSQASNTYDVFSTIEHETDEVLGTASCIDTQTGSLTNPCPGANTPSAADLFRYSGPGTLVLNSTTPGAYFSYNAGATNGTGGALYNTLPNNDDYADFVTNCSVPSSLRIQDATGCQGTSGLDITNDGGAEINILDAVGYNRTNSVPEPGSLLLLGAGLLAFCPWIRRKLIQ